MVKTYREVLTRASSFLEAQKKEGYAILYLFLARKSWSKTDWLLQMNQPISKEDEAVIEADLNELLTNRPPQYILGFEEFYGRCFEVTEATLIPRPETEELVACCLKENSANQPLSVIDIGTGTGAIAVSLKLERPLWQVSASDISGEALAVAKRNARKLGADIGFYQGDTLKPVIGQKFDLILSNPPYISPDEWELMDESVREYEPKQALFAENNGLAIYQKLAEEAVSVLKPTGKIYLEIGFQQGIAVQKIFQSVFPKKQVRILQDLAGKDRIIAIS